ncbi:hypothetical protein KSS87_004969 [Heliosperma pusillum]|nr:hypothetical protein KSS87_004969 [Heliosperma pusillum]
MKTMIVALFVILTWVVSQSINSDRTTIFKISGPRYFLSKEERLKLRKLLRQFCHLLKERRDRYHLWLLAHPQYLCREV